MSFSNAPYETSRLLRAFKPTVRIEPIRMTANRPMKIAVTVSEFIPGGPRS